MSRGRRCLILEKIPDVLESFLVSYEFPYEFLKGSIKIYTFTTCSSLENISKQGFSKPFLCLGDTQVPSEQLIQETSRNNTKMCKGFSPSK